MKQVRLAIVGVGNCASSLLQGLALHRGLHADPAPGVRSPLLGGYALGDLLPVVGFDVDARKVGRPLGEAIFAAPNDTAVFHRHVTFDGPVLMAPVLDGVAGHLAQHPPSRRVVVADSPPADMARALREHQVDILLNYLPVGSQQATEHLALACLDAGVGLVNCIPAFIASEPSWAARFQSARLPIVGDDVKAQVGATIVHRALVRLAERRGATVDRTYQLNVGGNTDFLNMLAHDRLASKRVSKTEAVTSQLSAVPSPEDVHVGPSDYVPWQHDRKVCFIRVEGRLFGGVPWNVEARLDVEDSPNSAGVVVDAIRCCQVARDRGLAGPLPAACAMFMKHPPQQMADEAAFAAVEAFLAGGAP